MAQHELNKPIILEYEKAMYDGDELPIRCIQCQYSALCVTPEQAGDITACYLGTFINYKAKFKMAVILLKFAIVELIYEGIARACQKK